MLNIKKPALNPFFSSLTKQSRETRDESNSSLTRSKPTNRGVCTSRIFLLLFVLWPEHTVRHQQQQHLVVFLLSELVLGLPKNSKAGEADFLWSRQSRSRSGSRARSPTAQARAQRARSGTLQSQPNSDQSPRRDQEIAAEKLVNLGEFS